MTDRHEPRPAIYVVATPIGNLDDMTPRAIKTLTAADMIAAEDTRNTRKLLSHLGISMKGKELVSYHDHNERARADSLIARLLTEEKVLAVVSDAGTPCIADPGFRLVQAARAAGIQVTPIPGPSSLTTLVSASGLPSNRLLFVGFLPTKDKALKTEFSSWETLGATIVFFESARRLSKTLKALAVFYPHATVVVGRELTKLFEEIVSLPISEALIWCETHASLRGEVSVVVDIGKPADESAERQGEQAADLRREISKAFKKGATLKDLLGQYRDPQLNGGLGRAELYALLLDIKKNGP